MAADQGLHESSPGGSTCGSCFASLESGAHLMLAALTPTIEDSGMHTPGRGPRPGRRHGPRPGRGRVVTWRFSQSPADKRTAGEGLCGDLAVAARHS